MNEGTVEISPNAESEWLEEISLEPTISKEAAEKLEIWIDNHPLSSPGELISLIRSMMK